MAQAGGKNICVNEIVPAKAVSTRIHNSPAGQTQIPLILALVSNAVANKGSFAPHACGLRPNDQPEGDGAHKYRLLLKYLVNSTQNSYNCLLTILKTHLFACRTVSVWDFSSLLQHETGSRVKTCCEESTVADLDAVTENCA